MGNDFGPLVLVFSPREEIRNLLTAGLLHSNFRIIEAATSYIAGIKANQYLPDVAVVDVAMDNIKDFLFLTRLERSFRTQEIPVIVSATVEVHEALNTIRDEVHSEGEGGRGSNVHILEYPFQFKKLIDTIDSVIANRTHGKQPDVSLEENEIIAERLFDRTINADSKLRDVESTVQQHWAFPFTVVRAIDIIGSDSSCCKELGKCIETDAGAASAVLKVANTVAYAKTSGRVSNITEAIVRIGFSETRNLMACLALIDISTNIHQKYGFTRAEFWAHSLSTAIIAEKLCMQAGVNRPELAFVSGLIHDIGKIPLDNNFRSVFPRLLEETTNRIASFHVMERYLMGFTHADLGCHLTTRWNFPSYITQSVRNHHDPEKIIEERVPIDRMIQESVYVANVLSKSMNLGHSCDEVLEEIPTEMLKELGIPKGPPKDFYDTVLARFRQFYEYLRISSSDITQPVRNLFPQDCSVTIVYGPEVAFHPLALALQSNGFAVKITRNLPRDLADSTRIAIFIPDRGSPLEITLDVNQTPDSPSESCLRIFLLDGVNVREQKRELTRSNIVLMDRRRFDLRLILHVIEDFYYATTM